MQRFGKIIQQLNRRQKMETETFECSFKRAFEKDLPSDQNLDPSKHEAVQHVFMFLSDSWRWICEFRVNMIWEYSPENRPLSTTRPTGTPRRR